MLPTFLAYLMLAGAPKAATALNTPGHDTVWVWNARCHDPIIVGIRVRLDSTTLYSSSIRICRWERRFEKGKASFQFTPHRPLVWYGYRSDDGDSAKDVGDTTPANAHFQIDLWQAGGETDVIEMGIVVAAPDGLHMHTIHLLWPTKRSETTIAPGLVLETLPQTPSGRAASHEP